MTAAATTRNSVSAARKAPRQARRAWALPRASRKNGQNSTSPNTAASTICGRAASVNAMSAAPATTRRRSMKPPVVPDTHSPKPQLIRAKPIASGRKYMLGVRAKIKPPPATNIMMSSTSSTPIDVRGNHRREMRASKYAMPATYAQSQMATPSHVGNPVPVSNSHGT